MLAPNWPKMQLGFALLCLLAIAGFALPLDPGRGKKSDDRKFPEVPRLPDIPGLDAEEYKRYWEEVVKNNPGLQERLSKLNPEKLANIHPRFAEQAARKPEEWMKNFRPEDVPNLHPHLGERLARSSEEIRSRLEEARRMNIDELRQLQKLQMLRENHPDPEAEWMARREAMREKLPPQFSHEQLQKRLEEQRKVLEDLDRKRREDFKRYEMQMEHQRKMKLKAMDEQHRLKAEEEFRQKHEKLMHHERVNQPASEQQLKEVWEEDDGLKKEDFDPKTFFNLHDTDGNGELDPMELEGLFYREVKKIFGSDVGGVEAHEEMARMREYTLQTVDKNHDGMISKQEFITHMSETTDEEEWHPMVDQSDNYFSDEELEKFEEHYDDYYDYDYDDDGNIVSKSHPGDLEKEQQEQQVDREEGVPGDALVHEEQQPARGGEEQAQEEQPARGGEEQAQEEQPARGGEGEQKQEPRLNGDPAAQTLPEDQKMIVEALHREKEGQAQQFVKDPQDHPAPQEQDEKRQEQ